MRLVHLQIERVVGARRRKCGANGRTAIADRVPEELSVNAVFAEVLVQADVLLLGVVEAGRVEVSVVEDRRGARNAVIRGAKISHASQARSLVCALASVLLHNWPAVDATPTVVAPFGGYFTIS